MYTAEYRRVEILQCSVRRDFFYFLVYGFEQVGMSEKILEKTLFFKNEDCHNDNMSQLYLESKFTWCVHGSYYRCDNLHS